jgi:hypothetical protein
LSGTDREIHRERERALTNAPLNPIHLLCELWASCQKLSSYIPEKKIST